MRGHINSCFLCYKYNGVHYILFIFAESFGALNIFSMHFRLPQSLCLEMSGFTMLNSTQNKSLYFSGNNLPLVWSLSVHTTSALRGNIPSCKVKSIVSLCFDNVTLTAFICFLTKCVRVFCIFAILRCCVLKFPEVSN